MVSPSSAASNDARSRLRREDFRRTKHDSAFSQWKILIGPSDWKDHSTAKEREEKYGTQNLRNWTFCPGVYELGVAASCSVSGRGARKIKSRSVVPVYLGQADNLRNRLQQYGRDGSHLENGCSNDKENGSSHNGLGLFTDVFSRGLAILYRCAPTKSKKDAETTERQLLDTFDYAWNKGSNGPRRPNDIHKKLEHLSTQSQFSLLVEKFTSINKKPVGIKITTCEPKNGSSVSNADGITVLSRIFGGKRVQPRQHEHSVGSICGVALGRGSVCSVPPVEGRKRCALHKGMKINDSVLNMNGQGNAVSDIVEFQDRCCSPVCGFVLEDGSTCRKEPVRRKKRCSEHKGKMIQKSKTV